MTWTEDDVAAWKRELADLEQRIAAYPYWGAALSVMDERARGLRFAIKLATDAETTGRGK